MKRAFFLLLSVLMLMSCAACGAPASETAATPVAATEVPIAELSPVEVTQAPTAEPTTAGEEAKMPEPAQTEGTDNMPVIGVDTSTLPVTDSIRPFLTDTATPISAFSSTDTLGLPVTEDFFADYTLTMVNFWEPWCGPCVGEMPDLQRLYEDYSGKGFTIMGVYSTADGVEELLADLGITYPIVQYVNEFSSFQTGYVPTTIFVNSKGEVISAPAAGSNSYEGWAEIVDYFLG